MTSWDAVLAAVAVALRGERALTAHSSVGAGDLAAIAIPDAAGMAASLHLDLGDGYLRQGRRDEARAQLDAGLAARTTLGDDGYATTIRKGLDGLHDRIARTGCAHPGPTRPQGTPAAP